MKSTLHSSAAAAAMLLASLGALLVAQPAAAQHRYEYAQHGGDRAEGYGWGHRYGRDDRAPQITQVSPSHGDRVSDRGWTRISARFSDQGSGVDPASVVLRIDGRDVTRRARVDGDDIRYAGGQQRW